MFFNFFLDGSLEGESWKDGGMWVGRVGRVGREWVLVVRVGGVSEGIFESFYYLWKDLMSLVIYEEFIYVYVCKI